MKRNLFDHFPQHMRVTARSGRDLTKDEIEKLELGGKVRGIIDTAAVGPGLGGADINELDSIASSPWNDVGKVQGLFGDLKGITDGLAKKTGTETVNHSGDTFDPNQLFSASDSLAKIYMQMMRGRQG